MARLPVIEFAHGQGRRDIAFVGEDPMGSSSPTESPPALRYIVRNGQNGSKLDLCRPLDSGTGLVHDFFARTATAPEGVLSFVQQYGPLTHGGNDESQGDMADYVMSHARTMGSLLNP